VGAHLLGEIADRSGLSSGFSAAVPFTGERAPGHDRGRLLAQVAVMLAAGGRCVADMAALRDQPDLFGQVASGPTIWRAVHELDAHRPRPGAGAPGASDRGAALFGLLDHRWGRVMRATSTTPIQTAIHPTTIALVRPALPPLTYQARIVNGTPMSTDTTRMNTGQDRRP
jgi:hypothetical protein